MTTILLDRDEALRLLDRHAAMHFTYQRLRKALLDELRALLTDAPEAGDAEDAARYRWLIENAGHVNQHIQAMWSACKTPYPSPEEWSAAIDRARSAEKENGDG